MFQVVYKLTTRGWTVGNKKTQKTIMTHINQDWEDFKKTFDLVTIVCPLNAVKLVFDTLVVVLSVVFEMLLEMIYIVPYVREIKEHRYLDIFIAVITTRIALCTFLVILFRVYYVYCVWLFDELSGMSAGYSDSYKIFHITFLAVMELSAYFVALVASSVIVYGIMCIMVGVLVLTTKYIIWDSFKHVSRAFNKHWEVKAKY